MHASFGGVRGRFGQHAQQKSLLLAITLACIGFAAPPTYAQEGMKVGYVERFEGSVDTISIMRGDADIPVSILLPIESGDRVEVLNAASAVTLRLLDQMERVVVTHADGIVTIDAAPPPGDFWSELLGWTANNVRLLDEAARNQGPGVRGSPLHDLSAPILASDQHILASRRPLFVGWISPHAVRIRLVAADSNEVIVAGEGAGGIWWSEEIDLAPGHYRLELSVPGDSIEIGVDAVAPADWPAAPPSLDRQGIPSELRQAALATWLASQSDAYLLESLQIVAPFAERYRAAELLKAAFVAGRRPPPPR